MARHGSSRAGGGTATLPMTIMTIASDEEVDPETDSETESTGSPPPLSVSAKKSGAKGGKKRPRQDGKGGGAVVDPTFSFDADSSTLGLGNIQATRGWDFKSELCVLCTVVYCCSSPLGLYCAVL